MKSSNDVLRSKGTLNRGLTVRQLQVLQTIALFQKLHGGQSPSRHQVCELLGIKHNQLFKALQGLYRRQMLVKAWRQPSFELTPAGLAVLAGKHKTSI
jgi:hypothetical protein